MLKGYRSHEVIIVGVDLDRDNYDNLLKVALFVILSVILLSRFTTLVSVFAFGFIAETATASVSVYVSTYVSVSTSA